MVLHGSYKCDAFWSLRPDVAVVQSAFTARNLGGDGEPEVEWPLTPAGASLWAESDGSEIKERWSEAEYKSLETRVRVVEGFLEGGSYDYQSVAHVHRDTLGNNVTWFSEIIFPIIVGRTLRIFIPLKTCSWGIAGYFDWQTAFL